MDGLTIDTLTGNIYKPLENGYNELIVQVYSIPGESEGVFAISISAIISFLAVLILLIAIAVSSLRHREGQEPSPSRRFITSAVGVYFLCLLLSHMLSSFGFMMSIKWAIEKRVVKGKYCTIQASIKQFGNVALSLWCLVIAVHSFVVVFIRKPMSRLVPVLVIGVVWFVVFILSVVVGLYVVEDTRGPWWGPSQDWCWTSDNYPVERFTTEYMYMFVTSLCTLVLYTLMFLNIRGNLQVVEGSIKFSFKRQKTSHELNRAAKQMLWHPFVFAVSVLPIATCRVVALRGGFIPFWLKTSTAVLFMLSGLANTILYTWTRRMFSISQFMPFHHNRSSTYSGPFISNPTSGTKQPDTFGDVRSPTRIAVTTTTWQMEEMGNLGDSRQVNTWNPEKSYARSSLRPERGSKLRREGNKRFNSLRSTESTTRFVARGDQTLGSSTETFGNPGESSQETFRAGYELRRVRSNNRF